MSRKAIISKGIGDNVISQAYLARSLQKYKQGIRSSKKLVFKGKELKGQYLVSTYLEAEYCVITTPAWQWVGPTKELGEHAEAALVESHKKTAKTWAFVLEPKEKE